MKQSTLDKVLYWKSCHFVKNDSQRSTPFPLKVTLVAHVRTWAYVPVGALVSITNTPGRKKRALISSHSELLDGNSTVRKSGFYGLCGILNPWSCLPAQQFQDPE